MSQNDDPIRLLAIETADRHGSIAAAVVSSAGAFTLVEHQPLPRDQRSAQSLAPAIHGLLSRHDWQPGSLSLVAAATGPGSFTGLRIGVTTTKTLAYAVGARVVGINTLSALAVAGGAAQGRVVAAIDAYRSELFVSCFDNAPAAGATVELIRRDSLHDRIGQGDTVVSPLADQLEPLEGVTFRPAVPNAAAVAELAAAEHAAGRTLSPFELSIDYCRASAAEEKLSGS